MLSAVNQGIRYQLRVLDQVHKKLKRKLMRIHKLTSLEQLNQKRRYTSFGNILPLLENNRDPR